MSTSPNEPIEPVVAPEATGGDTEGGVNVNTPVANPPLRPLRKGTGARLMDLFRALSFRHKILVFVVPVFITLLLFVGRTSESPTPPASDTATVGDSSAPQQPVPVPQKQSPRFSNVPLGSSFTLDPSIPLPRQSPALPGGTSDRAGVVAQPAFSYQEKAAPAAISGERIPVSTTAPVVAMSADTDRLFGGSSLRPNSPASGEADTMPAGSVIRAGNQPPAMVNLGSVDARSAAGTPYRPAARRERDQEQEIPEIFGHPFELRAAAEMEAIKRQQQSAQVSAGAAEGGGVVGGSQRSQPSASAAARMLPAQSNGLKREFAPFGRLAKIELLNTIDSLAPGRVPFIGIIMEDINWNGRTIIPANTEVHGNVLTDPLIDIEGQGRLFAEENFTLVFPQQGGRINGREMLIKGSVLDRRETLMDPLGQARAWGVADLAPGLIGDTISTVDKEELKLFAAAFLSGVSKSVSDTLLEREQVATPMGGVASQPVASVSNALISGLGGGVGGAMDQVVERLQDSIAKRGVYVRVRAGKTLYLYIQETLDPTRADIGLRLPEQADKDRVRRETRERDEEREDARKRANTPPATPLY